jgi:hypothetical protein
VADLCTVRVDDFAAPDILALIGQGESRVAQFLKGTA